ncbi:plasmid mobilization protein [Embleya sp. NPDC127516]|uniref:plasmid mobilization protein n=1 Tax=Embleya sp. NPDC127516 TaxID=3363990 RepID=UPI003828FB6D
MSDELPFATTQNLLGGASKQGVGPSVGRSHASTPIPEGGDGAHGPQHRGARREGELPYAVADTPPHAPVDASAAAPAKPRIRKRKKIQRKPVSVRLSPSERAELQEAATTEHHTLARYIADAALARARATGFRVDGADDALLDELVRTRTALVRAGTLFNQVAHRLNAGGSTRPEDTALAAAVTDGIDHCRRVVERVEAATDLRLGRTATR